MTVITTNPDICEDAVRGSWLAEIETRVPGDLYPGAWWTPKTLFTTGECHGLAIELAELTGFTVISYEDNNYAGHVFCETPTGLLVDIHGPNTRQVVEHEWGKRGYTNRTVNPELDLWGPYDVLAAQEWAHRLAAHWDYI